MRWWSGEVVLAMGTLSSAYLSRGILQMLTWCMANVIAHIIQKEGTVSSVWTSTMTSHGNQLTRIEFISVKNVTATLTQGSATSMWLCTTPPME
jgi:hypothetical protein